MNSIQLGLGVDPGFYYIANMGDISDILDCGHPIFLAHY